MYASGERVRVHKDCVLDLATVRAAVPSTVSGGWTLFLLDDIGGIHEIEIASDDTQTVTKIQTDGGADSARVLAGMWTRWMSAGHQCRIQRDRLDTTAPIRSPDHRRLRRDAAPTSASLPTGGRTGNRENDHGRAVPARDAAPRPGPPGNHRLPREPHLEMGRRLPSLPRRRPAPPHRTHRS
jgi:hypothetical protein